MKKKLFCIVCAFLAKILEASALFFRVCKSKWENDVRVIVRKRGRLLVFVFFFFLPFSQSRNLHFGQIEKNYRSQGWRVCARIEKKRKLISDSPTPQPNILPFFFAFPANELAEKEKRKWKKDWATGPISLFFFFFPLFLRGCTKRTTRSTNDSSWYGICLVLA